MASRLVNTKNVLYSNTFFDTLTGVSPSHRLTVLLIEESEPVPNSSV